MYSSKKILSSSLKMTAPVTPTLYTSVKIQRSHMATMGFIQKQNQKEETPTQNSALVAETFTHSIAFGETGSGKTSSFIYPNLQKRIQLGHGILLYDYKGKEHLSVKHLAFYAGRLDDVVEIGKPWGESINLIEKMDEDELDKFFDNILKHGEDSQYWQNSAKSLGQTLLIILKAIENFSIALKCVEGIDREEIESASLNPYKYPTKRTLFNLVKVCKTFEVLKLFIKELDALYKAMNRLTKRAARYSIADKGLNKSQKERLLNLIAQKELFKNVIDTNKNSLENFGEDSNENLTQNIIGSLISPLITLSRNKYLNTNSFDIAKALNAGKIIIINTESLSNSVLESLNNSILYELSKRTKRLHLHPISIFIDEVQRVVSTNTDLPIDVFREAKVDMFLATQNSSLLIEKLKEEKFNALMGNLTLKFYYKSSHDEAITTEYTLEELAPFSYITSDNSYTKLLNSKPLFFTRDALLAVEFRYQKINKVLENFLYKYKNAKIIANYDARLYKENKLLIIDLTSQKEYIVESLTKENMDYLKEELDKLLEKITQHYPAL